jgi:adenylate kinase family enzyme
MISPGCARPGRRSSRRAEQGRGLTDFYSWRSLIQRVLVLGCSGAGKSTFSRRLAPITDLPRVELDVVFWRPGWVETQREEFLAIVAKLCEKPAWILDGNYASSLHIRLPRADTVILLDYPRHLCLWRVLTRTARDYGRVRKTMLQVVPSV